MADTLTFSNTKGTKPIRLDQPVTFSVTPDWAYPTEPTEALQVSLSVYLVSTFSAVPYRITVTSENISGVYDYIPDAETVAGAFIDIPLNAGVYFRMQSIETVQLSVTSADGRAEPRNLYIGLPEESYNVRLAVTWQYATRPQPPTTVSCPLLPQKDSYDPTDRYIHVTWNGIRPAYDGSSAGPGRIQGAIVQRATAPDGPWSTLATAGGWDQTFGNYDDRTFDVGRKYWYRVIVRAQNTAYNSDPSKTTAGIGSDDVDNYIAAPCGRGCTYNPRPRILFRAGYPFGAVGIFIDPTMQRGDNLDFIPAPASPVSGQTFIIQKRTDAPDGAATKSLYWEGNPRSGTGYFPVYYTKSTAVWTDPDLTSGMPIKAAHIMELRAAYDNVCDYFQTDRTEWGDDVIAGKTSVQRWPEHVRAIQQTAARIATRINNWGSQDATLNVTLPAFLNCERPNAAAIVQLRQILLLL